MGNLETEEIVRALNEMNHETLSHDIFQRCFGEAVRTGKISGLKKTSLFRSTIAYFLLVPDARESFLRELSSVKA